MLSNSSVVTVPAFRHPGVRARLMLGRYGHGRGLGGIGVADAPLMADVVGAKTKAPTIMIAERVTAWIEAAK